MTDIKRKMSGQMKAHGEDIGRIIVSPPSSDEIAQVTITQNGIKQIEPMFFEQALEKMFMLKVTYTSFDTNRSFK